MLIKICYIYTYIYVYIYIYTHTHTYIYIVSDFKSLNNSCEAKRSEVFLKGRGWGWRVLSRAGMWWKIHISLSHECDPSSPSCADIHTHLLWGLQKYNPARQRGVPSRLDVASRGDAPEIGGGGGLWCSWGHTLLASPTHFLLCNIWQKTPARCLALVLVHS